MHDKDRQTLRQCNRPTTNALSRIYAGKRGKEMCKSCPRKASKTSCYIALTDHLHSRSNIHNRYRQIGREEFGHQHGRNAMRKAARNAEFLARCLPLVVPNSSHDLNQKVQRDYFVHNSDGTKRDSYLVPVVAFTFSTPRKLKCRISTI
jgi:hypothetical protein